MDQIHILHNHPGFGHGGIQMLIKGTSPPIIISQMLFQKHS